MNSTREIMLSTLIIAFGWWIVNEGVIGQFIMRTILVDAIAFPGARLPIDRAKRIEKIMNSKIFRNGGCFPSKQNSQH